MQLRIRFLVEVFVNFSNNLTFFRKDIFKIFHKKKIISILNFVETSDLKLWSSYLIYMGFEYVSSVLKFTTYLCNSFLQGL